jgi:thioredoxin-dependent peroxiredoxin
MEERMGDAFAGTEQLTVIGRRLHPGGIAPDFCLHYLDLVDMAVHTVRLSDLAGMVRLLNVVNSLQRPICQVVTRRWEALCAMLPPDAYIYTVSMDPPQMQARWQDQTGVLHQALSAHHSVQFGQDYGVWLREWHQLQRSVVVIDRSDRIVYVEYVVDQMSEPDYTAAIQAVQQAAGQ